MERRMWLWFPALAALTAAPLSAQVADFVPRAARSQDFDLSVRSIMRGAELMGQSPTGVRWSDDSEWIYFNWLPGGNDWYAQRELYRVPAEGGEPELVPEDQVERVGLITGGGEISSDGRWKLSTFGRDLYLVNRSDLSVRQLTDTRAGESSAIFSEDGEHIIYRQGQNLFSMEIDGGSVVQLTDVRSGSAPEEDEEAEGLEAFLERQQAELFEHIRLQSERRVEREARQEAAQEGEPEPLYIPSGDNLGGMQPSRDGRYVLFSTNRPARGGERTMVPDWVTESGYTEPINGRTKVGEEPGSGRVGVLTTATGEVSWLDGKPDDYDGLVSTSGGGGAWNDAGTHAIVTARSDDDQDRWLYVVEAATGDLKLLNHRHDDAWVGGPCGGCRGWIPGTDRIYFATEETGYAHLYSMESDGSDRRALTSGDWEVLSATILDGQDRFLVRTNEGSPFNEHAGWLDFDGGEIEYLTQGEGRFGVTVSPDGERLAIIHDLANRPQELFVARESRPSEMTRITTSPTEEWLSFPWTKPDIVRFRAADGTMVPARIYRPADVGGTPNGAAVIFVHGSGYLHNVHNYWSSYSREYMFNHLLAAQGYTVLDIDYRGSAGYGRDWRTGIYRWMGGKDLSDQVDGTRYLVAEEGIDARRIGLYGGSYGGFITLMGLFTAGDTFKSGAALRSVTDWAHYNDGYTSNILNDPQEDEEAYKQSSPIYFAENFGPDQHLVMLHGMVDTNVHFSDAVRLTQRLIELGKENWEMAVYPVESHGFVEPTSWTDEYRRIFELFERTLARPDCTEDGGYCEVPAGG